MRPGNTFVLALCSLAMVLQVELRSIIAAAAGPSSYGDSPAATGSGLYSGSSTGSGHQLSGTSSGGSGAASGYRWTAAGSEAGDYFARSGAGGGGGYSGYSSYNRGGYSPSSAQNDDQQKETKYYYGGKYQGSCVADGLYYRDDTTFVICSNGYPHEQPCPPGTKTSGSPRYQPGYYYGYTDLCSVNLVDYGYGPEYYAPRGYPDGSTASGHHGRELQGSGGQLSATAGGGLGHQGSTGYGGHGGGSAVSAGGSGSAYDRVGSYGSVRESGFNGGQYGGSSSKNRQYDATGSGYGSGKKDTWTGSGGSRPAAYGFGDSKPSSGSSSYQSAGDSLYSSKSRDLSLSKSPYIDKKYI